MNTPTPKEPRHNKPTPDDLAGTPACREEGPTVRPGSPGVRARGRRGGAEPPPLQGLPTAGDLAGTPFCCEEEEESKGPRRGPGQQQ